MWALLGFGPTIMILALGTRALRRDTGDSWADFRDINTVLDWITPGLVVIAIISLARLKLTRYEAAAFSAGPLLTYIFASYLPSRLSRRRREASIDRLTAARLFIAGNGRLLSLTFLLFLQGFIYTGFLAQLYVIATGGMPTLSLFVSIVVAGRIGEWALGRLAAGIGRWKPLAPGDLYKRVIEIASKSKVQVDDVRILEHYPEGYVGAIAHSGSCIGLGEELITKLDKDEVDAVIAHEVGHLGDVVLWQYSYPACIIVALAWYGAVSYIERTIRSSPDLRSLQYLNWMAMFILPGLVIRWYSRYSERKADANVAVLENPGAAISGFYKLYMLNELPIDRPWWSRILGTHPTAAEDIETIARRSGLSVDQVGEAKRRAEMEVQFGPSDRYAIAFHEEPRSEVEKRGSRPVEIAIWIVAIVLACSFMFGSFFLAVLYEQSGWRMAAIIAAGVLATALVIVAPIEAYNRRKTARVQSRVTAKLAEKYGKETIGSMVLVDARLTGDDDVWQGALLGIRDGKLVLLAESREVAIPLDGKLEVRRWNNDYSSGEGARMVVIWYEVESVRQWVVVRVFGKPERGLPRSRNDFERYIKDLITGGGGTLHVRKKPPMRQVLVRTPIALLIMAAVLGLVQLVASLAGLKDMLFIHGLVLSSLGSALYYWVAKRPHPGESDEADG